ncbi:lipopolysaccharide biosynthesis protein [Shouchella sp. JSM 1781072]|uniref:lipopolysaccharide biosynthesis protein n=1 Tax=Shouchella sp. JSM 1781072 TaxID=3344581 RepID=UPI0035C1F266
MKKKSFVRNVMTLMTGTAIGQILTIASAPLLTRLYSPEDFGVLGLYISIISVVIVIMTLKYELAIVLPNDEKEAANLFWLSVIIITIITGILLLLVALFRETISNVLGVPALSKWLWFVPISASAMGLYNSFNYWSTRKKQFKRLSNSRVTQSSGMVGTQLLGGVINAGTSGLVIGQIVGQLAGVGALWLQVWKEDKRLLINSFDLKQIKKLAKEYVDFPLFNSSQSLLNSLSQNAAPVLLSFFFSPIVVGYYTMALRLIKMPINLISESFRQVYFQRVSELYNKGQNLSKELQKATLYLAAIAIIPAVLVFFIAPSTFALVLGEEWYIAGQYASWLVVWLYGGFINRPAVSTIQILKKQKYLLQYEIILFVVRVVLLAFCAHYYNALIAIAIYSISGALFNFLLIILTIFLLKENEVKR